MTKTVHSRNRSSRSSTAPENETQLTHSQHTLLSKKMLRSYCSCYRRRGKKLVLTIFSPLINKTLLSQQGGFYLWRSQQLRVGEKSSGAHDDPSWAERCLLSATQARTTSRSHCFKGTRTESVRNVCMRVWSRHHRLIGDGGEICTTTGFVFRILTFILQI